MYNENTQSNQQLINAYHQDGLLDIFIGLGILIASAFFLSGLFWLVAILPAVGYPVWMSAKSSITAPRVAIQEQNQGNRAVSGFLIAGIVALFLGVGMFAALSVDLLGSGLTEWLEANFPLVLGAVAGLLFALTALLTGIGRLYLYALLALAIISGGSLLNLPGALYGPLLGLIILVYGSVLLARFLGEHPRLEV